MIRDFVEHKLAEVDDLAELKVTLVALRLLEMKVSPSASVNERELLAHPAIRDGLSFPKISLSPALQRAVARGTLLCAQVGDERRYLVNDDAGRRVVDAVQSTTAPERHVSQTAQVASAIVREIERLEQLDAYALTDAELAAMDEWLARGYSQDEMLAATRLTLRSPRARHLPPRGVTEIGATLTATPPAQPSEYHAVVVAKTSRPTEDIINLRERLGRWPNAHEFALARAAVGLFGLRAVVDGLKRVSNGPQVDVDALIHVLAEQEEAALMMQRGDAQADVQLRAVVQLYESAFGLPPTGAIANEMQGVLKDVSDTALWQSVFAYAAQHNKRSWAYVRKLLQNPSPDVFLPQPANETATRAFDMYKKRVNRTLDASVANEINQLAQKVTDVAAWNNAFDKAAAANALRWDYIKKVLASSLDASAGKNHGRAKPTAKRGTTRKPQVEYSDAARNAAEERARQRLAKRPASE